MQLPYLKYRRYPRVAPGPTEQRLVQGSASDHLDDACMAEIFDACEKRDMRHFRSALEALVRNMFDWEGTESK